MLIHPAKTLARVFSAASSDILGDLVLYCKAPAAAIDKCVYRCIDCKIAMKLLTVYYNSLLSCCAIFYLIDVGQGLALQEEVLTVV